MMILIPWNAFSLANGVEGYTLPYQALEEAGIEAKV